MPLTAPQFDITEDDFIVLNDDFFPFLSLNKFKTMMRLVDNNDEPLLFAIQSSMFEANRELSSWVCQQVRLGYFLLTEVPSPSDNQSLAALYENAVFSGAKAMIIDSYRTQDTTGSGHNRADSLDLQSDMYYSVKRRNLRMMQNKPFIACELI